MSRPSVLCILLTTLMLAPGLAAAQGEPAPASEPTTGRRVDFPLMEFQDTLFTGVDGAFRVKLDAEGHVWYSTEGGVVHVDPFNQTREIFTRFEGLPSSYAIGLDVAGDKVYVGTDLGLGIIDRRTGEVEAVTPLNSGLEDGIVEEVRMVGAELWMGTRFFGVNIWNTTRPASDTTAWTSKNTSTTPDYSRAVRRIVPTPAAVWVATDGDGVWRYDRASKTWNVTIYADGLPHTGAYSVAERDGETWFGTANGIGVRSANGAWRYYNKSNSGLPHDRVLDLDVLPTTGGSYDVFAATGRGLWQFDPSSGSNVTRSQSFGILGSYVFDHEWSPRGWLFATTRGISHLSSDGWSYYATGPSSGPSWGPLSFGFTSASVGDGNGWLWFGSGRGLSAYRLPADGQPGWWQNFGEWQNYPGSVVNWIDTEKNVTWFGTNNGAYGFEHDTGKWRSRLAEGARNLVYAVDAVGDEIWVALFGDGLIMENFTTGITRSWSFETVGNPLPDEYITDVRVDGNDVWLGASVGAIRLNRETGAVLGSYGRSDGLPGSGIVFRLLPEGPTVWVGTKDGGVAKFDVASGKVSRVWNQSSHPQFPGGETRSLFREGSRLWVGTNEGLARIDVTTGEVRGWNQTNSALIQNFVNGISAADGVLYLATLSGIQRMDIATGEFYPMRDGPGVIRASSSAGAAGPVRLGVRIESPRDGSGVTGPTEIRGSALAFGAKVDRVEVRIGDGPWLPAEGAETWRYDWDASGLPADTPVAITARAFAGAASGEAEILVTPVAAPKVPLRIEDVAPDEAFAGRPLQMGARVEGDEPLAASLYYRPAGASEYTRLQLTRHGGLFLGTIPAREMLEGEMRYYFEATSGILRATAAGDAREPSGLTVVPPPRLAVRVEGPPLVEAPAGEETPFTLRVTNVGTQPATFRLSAAGLRAAWVALAAEDLPIGPGETRDVVVGLAVPAAAFADNTTLSFEVRDAEGVAEPAHASVPIRIQAAQAPPSSETPAPEKGRVIPGPGLLLLVAAAALVLVLRRRTP